MRAHGGQETERLAECRCVRMGCQWVWISARVSRPRSSTWIHLATYRALQGHTASVRPCMSLCAPYCNALKTWCAGDFIIYLSIAYAHKCGVACNSPGVSRGVAPGFYTTNMAGSRTEGRLPREFAQSSAPVPFAGSIRAASRTVPPATDLHPRGHPSVLSSLAKHPKRYFSI